MIDIIEPGIATTFQDGGRPGLAHLGISPAGAVDGALAGLLNRAVGNPADAAVLETAGGLRLVAVGPITAVSSHHAGPLTLRPGETLTVAAGGGRQWHYVAVRGGFDVEPVLGSRSTDTMSGLGPATPTPGQRLAVGPEPSDPVADVVPISPPTDRARLSDGPRRDWFAADALDRLTGAPLVVTATSRVGVRLRGVDLRRTRRDELPSEGLVRGAIQVPPDGDPIMMLADHPTTGGYPVVAVVHPDDVAVVAQRPAGTAVRFTR